MKRLLLLAVAWGLAMMGVRREPRITVVTAKRLVSSWYGPKFAGRETASGELFNPRAMTAASRYYPLGTRLSLCLSGRCVTVRVNDRGPYVTGRQLDVSEAVAERLGFKSRGLAMLLARELR